MTELAPGQVTIADLYRELTGMRQDIGRALTRIEVMDARTADADRLHTDHEARIRSLEAFKWKLAGAVTVLAMIAGVVSGAVAAHLH